MIISIIKLTKRIIFLFLIVLCNQSYGRQIWVSLYNNTQVRSVVVSAYNGPLTVSCEGRSPFTIPDGQAVYVTLHERKMMVNNTDGLIGIFTRLSIQGADSTTVVRLKPSSPNAESRNYEETVYLKADIDRIWLVNRLDEEHYIAGVVEAEVGAGRTAEFYKAKAVICRTYLYGHINRHAPEGFHLCDETHCQAYKGQCRHSNLIRESVYNTGKVILTDQKDAKPILAAYHSNCGGETESAKNAWQSNMPYLVPVVDPHCTAQLNARWQKTISLDEWLAYLVKSGFKPNPKVVNDFNFQQTQRVANYTVNDFSLPTKQIRMDWNLRSAFFSVNVANDQVLISGKGYGHGVGLCQEGAMEMGRKGVKYDDIIGFYYKYVNLVPVSSLQIEIPEFEMK